VNRDDIQQRHSSQALARTDATSVRCEQAEYSVTWVGEVDADCGVLLKAADVEDRCDRVGVALDRLRLLCRGAR